MCKLNATKVLVVLFLSFVTSVVYATKPGFYLGGQLGWGYLHQGKFLESHLNDALGDTLTSYTSKPYGMLYDDTGMAGRIYMGFQLNPYFALETGYTRFSAVQTHVNFNADVKAGTVIGGHEYNAETSLNFKTNVYVKTQAVDMVLKGIFPFTDKFSLYAKGGVAMLYTQGRGYVDFAGRGDVTDVFTGNASMHIEANPTASVIYPTFGVGANYDLTDHTSVDFGYTRIQAVSNHLYPSIDMMAAGLSYHF